MRSFPVSDGPLAGTAVSVFGAVWSGFLSCAKAPDAQHIAKRKLIKPRRIGSIGCPHKKSGHQINHVEIHAATRNLQAMGRLPLTPRACFARTGETDENETACYCRLLHLGFEHRRSTGGSL